MLAQHSPLDEGREDACQMHHDNAVFSLTDPLMAAAGKTPAARAGHCGCPATYTHCPKGMRARARPAKEPAQVRPRNRARTKSSEEERQKRWAAGAGAAQRKRARSQARARAAYRSLPAWSPRRRPRPR